MRNKNTVFPIFISLFFLIVFVSCQKQKSEWKAKVEVIDGLEVVVNPEEPMSEKAGRILKLEEVSRISDKGEKFYFKSPSAPRFAADGSIFIEDTEQILKFSPEGKFQKNLFKKGQGPGEISGQYSSSIDVFRDEIYVHDIGTDKKITMDLDGNVKEESRMDSAPGTLKWVTENWIIYSDQIWPPREERTGKLCDMKNLLICVSKQGEHKSKTFNFPTKSFLSPQAAVFWSGPMWIINKKSEHIYISHSRKYLIKQLDLNAGKVIRGFKRKYPRVEMKIYKESHKKYNVPKKKYENDVKALFIYKDFLWVMTSTYDDDKGILIDVFDKDGIFVDNFYFDVLGGLLGTYEDMLFVQEQDGDENIIIVNYRIVY